MSFKEHYNQKSYKKISRFRKESVLSFIKKDNALVLDIGCSDGTMGSFVKEMKKSKVYGLDISKSAIQEAKRKLDATFVFDIEDKFLDIPEELASQKFDYIIISEVLEHLLYPEKVLENIKSLMHRDTEVIVTVPNILFWKNRLKIFFGKFDYTTEGLMDRGHIHFFTLKSLYKMIFKSGFKVVGHRYNAPTRLLRVIKNIFPGLCSYQFAVSIKKKKKVIYTAIFGDKDILMDPELISDDFHYICFTDGDIESDVWQIKKVKGEFSDSVLNSKIYKILPHKYFPDYDVSVWIDANILIKKDIDVFVENILAKHNIAFYSHANLLPDSRDTVMAEADTLIEMVDRGKKKVDINLIKDQMMIYKKDGFLDNYGLIVGGIIVRRHNKPEVMQAMEDWWQEIKKYTSRDQLSFNYIAWKRDLDFGYIDGNLRDCIYFKLFKHKK